MSTTTETPFIAVPGERVTDSAGVTKYDGGKPRLELLPVFALREVGAVMTYGANKYDDHNWRAGSSHTRYIGAALRHLFAWLAGEDNDPESGLNHLAHGTCCVLFVLDNICRKAGTDDRYSTLVRASQDKP